MAIVEVFLLIAHRLPHSQGQWKPSVCNPQSNRTVTRCPNVMVVDVELRIIVLVRMSISAFLTRRDTTRIEAVHWERGSLNGCLLFQASTCIVKFMHIVYATVLWYTHGVKYRYTSMMAYTVRRESEFRGCIDRFHLILCGEPSKTQSWRSLCWPVVRHKLEQLRDVLFFLRASMGERLCIPQHLATWMVLAAWDISAEIFPLISETHSSPRMTL